MRIDTATLEAAMQYIRPSVSTDATRRTQNGVQIRRINGSGVWAIGTDGHRMHMSKLDCELEQCYFPMSIVETVLSEAAITIDITPTTLETAGLKVSFSADITPINIEAFIETTHKQATYSQSVIDCKALRKACKESTTTWIVIGSTPDDSDKCGLFVKSGEAWVRLGDWNGPSGVKVAVNIKYILDAIKGSTSVMLSLAGKLDPIVVEDTGKKAYVMPVRQ
jgi:DNA polymerase III sliding clamp (beta) subunit (PCNA family)